MAAKTATPIFCSAESVDEVQALQKASPGRLVVSWASMYNQTCKYRRTLKTDPLHWLWHAGFFGEFVAEVAGRVV